MNIVERIEKDFPQVAAIMDKVPVRFAPDWLKASAVVETGLTDFGPDFFEESLDRLCHSLNEEADLNAYGRLLVAGIIRNQLANRMLLQRMRKNQPELLEKRPLAPIIVTGLPRTGTTFLHRLLAADPAHTSLAFWQLNRPMARDESDTEENRLAEAKEMLGIRQAITPELDGVHMIRAETPEECMWLTGSSMMSRIFWNLAPVYSWLEWYSAADKTNKYREYLELLSYLQTLYPGKRFVLKAPDHVDGVAELLDVIPQAKVICTHRDMIEQLGSYMSLGRITRKLASNEQDIERSANAIIALTDHSIERMARARARHPDSILDVRYTDMMADPLAQVERIYDHCGLTLPQDRRAVLSEHHAKNPKGKHGVHEYSLQQFGLENDWVRQRYENYSKKFLS